MPLYPVTPHTWARVDPETCRSVGSNSVVDAISGQQTPWDSICPVGLDKDSVSDGSDLGVEALVFGAYNTQWGVHFTASTYSSDLRLYTLYIATEAIQSDKTLTTSSWWSVLLVEARRPHL